MTPGIPEMPLEVFERRRAAVFDALDGGTLVLPAAPVQHRSRDTERPYAPDRELYYLTGATEAATVAVLVGGAEPRWELFVPDRDPDAELWGGPMLGPEGAAELFGPTECHPLSRLGDVLPGILAGAGAIHYRLGRGGATEGIVLSALTHGRARGGRSGTGPRSIVDPGEILDDLRLVKDEVEVERMRAAAAITAGGHRAGAAAIVPGVGEWVVESAVEGSFRDAGASGPGFETIVGSGINACVLHYVANGSEIGADDLVLVDAGAEYALYQGDVTRTFPASGRFSERQRAVYEVVEAGRVAAVAAARPGFTIADVHGAAARAIAEGLVDLGVLEGATDDLLGQGALKRYFPHQTSHWLGLDVHDPGDYARCGEARPLTAGMVFTVEPGLYFGAGVEGGAARFAGIGVRIEDDVLITADGCEVLSTGLPTDPDEIEALVGVER